MCSSPTKPRSAPVAPASILRQQLRNHLRRRPARRLRRLDQRLRRLRSLPLDSQWHAPPRRGVVRPRPRGRNPQPAGSRRHPVPRARKHRQRFPRRHQLQQQVQGHHLLHRRIQLRFDLQVRHEEQAGDYTVGQTFVLSVDAFISSGGVASMDYNQQAAGVIREGVATWLPLTDAVGVRFPASPIHSATVAPAARRSDHFRRTSGG